MADTTFVPGTIVASTWLNDVNRFTYDAPKTIGAGLIGTTEGVSVQQALLNRLSFSAMTGAIGTLAGRSVFNTLPANFQYLAADTGNLYVRNGPSGNWDGPFPFGGGGGTVTVNVGTTTTGAPGSSASVTNSGTSTNAVFNFTIPRGDTGAQGIPGTAGTNGTNGADGADGAAATIAVGTTTTLAPGSSATVTNVGTSSAAIFNFGIPQGTPGGGGGSGDVVGPASAVNNNMVVFDGTTGKLVKDGGAPLVIGTTGTTAKAGNYQPTAANISDSTTVGRAVLTATDAAAARTAIGAGTSNLVIGTTSTTAKAGDYAPTKADVGLSNVDNTSDANKPVSTAQALAISSIPGNSQTGTTYTLVLGDAGKRVLASNASAITLTVPPNSSVAFPVYTSILVTQMGAGQVTVAQGAGVTIQADGGLKVGAIYKSVELYKTATDTWLLTGGVA